MVLQVSKNENIIDLETRQLISKRYKTITRAVNREFWNITSDTSHSLYVGSYGRGTAVNTSDIDILLELPQYELIHYNSLRGNKQSKLLQAVKEAVQTPYPYTDIRADGQVIKVQFTDGMKLELLPAFKGGSLYRNSYTYPDSNMGGNWKSTNPQREQDAMKEKNKTSNGLLFDTCKHIRMIRDEYYTSYHLSGIVIDTFVYNNIGDWQWATEPSNSIQSSRRYEQELLEKFNSNTLNSRYYSTWYAPGSGQRVDTNSSIETLKKILELINQE
ncbi:nucleotidyltransferase [Alloscardovia theropitheci]|uniref:Nucleotidyltransferase n=1 Tax=Alloscardovia theropitheci TaxID=2496842 RepID=A0A4R0QX51_9BIFI|nr:nucleotidyltransferase domain-containing protein [Alloscardovia theropitheci]TCD54120.1 nucleotidyltransferase [Alloscardovia theropitheci]